MKMFAMDLLTKQKCGSMLHARLNKQKYTHTHTNTYIHMPVEIHIQNQDRWFVVYVHAFCVKTST